MSLPGNDFWARLVLLISDKPVWRSYIDSKRPGHVTTSFILYFTAMQV